MHVEASLINMDSTDTASNHRFKHVVIRGRKNVHLPLLSVIISSVQNAAS